MFREERYNYIINEVKIRNRVLLTDISKKLAVSEDTIRRDLIHLDEQGKIKKVHGGAISNSFHLYAYNEDKIYAHESKIIIASKVHQLIKGGEVIIMTGGTTNLEVARLFPKELSATVFTPSLPTAMQLLEHPQIETIFIGGKLSHQAQIAIGGEAIRTLMGIHADICLLGMGNLDAELGFTEFDWEIVQLKKAMLSSSKRIVAITISEKLHSAQRFNVCATKDIHTLITELEPTHSSLTKFREKGLEIL